MRLSSNYWTAILNLLALASTIAVPAMPEWSHPSLIALALIFVVSAFAVFFHGLNYESKIQGKNLSEKKSQTEEISTANSHILERLAVRDLFLHINSLLPKAGNAAVNDITSVVQDNLSLGSLDAWGRNDARYKFGKPVPLEKIEREYWLTASLDPFFFLDDDNHRDLVHAQPDAHKSGIRYRDIQVNRAQALQIWPVKRPNMTAGQI